MTDNVGDLEWIHEQNFELDALAKPAIAVVLRMTSFCWWDFRRKRGLIRVNLVAEGGDGQSAVMFEVVRRGPGTEVEIRRLPGVPIAK